MNITAFIDCDSYNVGPFIPVSFQPKLTWKIVHSHFIKHPNKLPKAIGIESHIGPHYIILTSHPYSWGEFSVYCNTLKGIHWDLRTNDPEDAVYRFEDNLKAWLEHMVGYYSGLLNTLEDR